jgi:hypothetical protein
MAPSVIKIRRKTGTRYASDLSCTAGGSLPSTEFVGVADAVVEAIAELVSSEVVKTDEVVIVDAISSELDCSVMVNAGSVDVASLVALCLVDSMVVVGTASLVSGG